MAERGWKSPLVIPAAIALGIAVAWSIRHRVLELGFSEQRVTFAAMVLGLLWAIFWMYRVLDDTDQR